MSARADVLVRQLDDTESYFGRSTACLNEEHSDYRPTDDQYTVAQHVGHAALTVDWFLEGAFGDGFDMDFEGHERRTREFSSLAAAREHLAAAFERARTRIAACSDEELLSALPDGPVMGGAPKAAIVQGIEEHTAHHRGALTVYSRMLGLTPPMPYM